MDALRAARYAEEMEFDRISREKRAQQQKELEETEASIREAAITLAKTKDSITHAVAELRQNEKITQTVIAANEANTGSIDQQRKQLAIVTAQWAKLSEDERKNTEQGKKYGIRFIEICIIKLIKSYKNYDFVFFALI